MSHNEVNKRLQKIRTVIPFDKLTSRGTEEATNIAKYYRLNRLAYSLFNSREGFVHMGISRHGTFKPTDFFEQAHEIASYIDASHASSILELAAGKAATTYYLATQYPEISFTGLDLPNGQLDVRTSKPHNLKLIEGDYHDLSRFAPASFDLVYIIEALCHARDKTIVMQEVARVLKPNGMFIIFDGYASKPRSALSKNEALVSDLTYTSMMVTKNGHLYKDLQKNLKKSHFTIVKEENLSQFVLPSIKRLESKAITYFNHPYVARLLNKILPIEVTGNAVAAYLMPLSFDSGLHQYWMTVATKKSR